MTKVAIQIVIATLALFCCSSATSQLTGSQLEEIDEIMRGYFHPRFDQVTLEDALSRIHECSDAHRIIIDEFYSEYLHAYEYKSQDWRSEIVAARHKRERENDGRGRFDVYDPSRDQPYDATDQLDWRRTKPRLDQQFENDVASVLTDEQFEQWHIVIRDIRRADQLPAERTFPNDLGIRGACDFVRILLDLELGDETTAPIRAEARAYELELDRLLKDVEVRGPQMHYAFEVAVRDDPKREDPKTRELLEEWHKYGRRVQRDIVAVCQRHFSLIAQAVPEHLRAGFIEQAGAEMFPNLYMPSPVELAFVELDRLDWLPPDLREVIAGLRDTYQASREKIYQRILRNERKAILDPPTDEETALLIAEQRAFMQASEENPQEYRVFSMPGMEPWRDRFLLTRRTLRRLKTLIPAETADGLPPHVRLLLALAEE